MPEEEILQEAAPAKKKKEGGGISFMLFVVIAIVLIVITAAGTMLVKTQIAGVGNTLAQKFDKNIKVSYAEGMTKGRKPIEECKNIVSVSSRKDPMIINLADGTHYLSVGISVCVPETFTAEEFTAKLPVLEYVCNEFLSTLTYASLFPAGGAQAKAKPAEEGFGDMALEEEGNAGPKGFSMRMDEVRGDLLKMFSERKVDFVEDVYFTSFLVQ